jgi:hypothetical protein
MYYYDFTLALDGDQWCALMGENLQEGIAGFGYSPKDACTAFIEALDNDGALPRGITPPPPLPKNNEEETAKMKAWIDAATYEELLSRWRFAKVGDPIFNGEVGKYFKETMWLKGNELGEEARVRASRKIGWN